MTNNEYENEGEGEQSMEEGENQNDSTSENDRFQEENQRCDEKEGTGYNLQYVGLNSQTLNQKLSNQNSEGQALSNQPNNSESLNNKPFQEMNALERLKYIQAQFKQQWYGISPNFTGRPGTSTLCNKKRIFSIPSEYVDDQQRQKLLLLALTIVKEIEQEIPLSIPISTDPKFGKSSQNFYSKAKSNLQFLEDSRNWIDQLLKNSPNEHLVFKPIKMSQLLNNLPPTSQFQRVYHVENSELLYKILRGDTKLVRSLLEANNFNYTESHEWNILWSSSSCKSYLYEGLNEYQKINHFPQSYEITRKDRLCFNLVKMQERFGKDAFDIVPDTYILPNEFKVFYNHFMKLKQTEPRKNIWIVKPANLSRGRGIHLIDDINDIDVEDLSVISRYITNPLLINGHKFDLRIYVVVTSYDPLRIYVYKEGLARFASETYSSKMNKDNKFMHLTNYSINKKNDNFKYNENQEEDDFGYKWSLSAFCNHLEQVGIDMDLLWSRIFDVIIKSIITSEHYVIGALKKNNTHRNNCFEIFGYDILIDSDLKPWLVEVNLSPSLATDSPLDMTIKSNLIADTLNLIGMKKFDRKKESLNKIKSRASKGIVGNSATNTKKYGIGSSNSSNGFSSFYQNNHTMTENNDCFLTTMCMNPVVGQIIEQLIAENDSEVKQLEEAIKNACILKYKDIITESLKEYQRRGNFVRIYPGKNSNIYDQYFQGSRPLNKVLYKVFYTSKLFKIDKQQHCKSSRIEQNPSILKQEKHEQTSNEDKKQMIQSYKSNGTKKQNEESKAQQEKSNRLESIEKTNNNNNQNSLNQISSYKESSYLEQSNISQSNNTNSTINASQFGYSQKVQTQRKNNQEEEKQGGVSKGLQRQKSLQPTPHTQVTPKRNQPQLYQVRGDSNSRTLDQKPVIMDQKGPSQQQQQQQQPQVPQNTSQTNIVQQSQQQQSQVEKVLITGDDILIEYVQRVVDQLKLMQNDLEVEEYLKEKLNKFIQHYVWHQKDIESNRFSQRVEVRLNEMYDRRRRLIKYMYKKEGRLDEFEEKFKENINKKNQVIRKFPHSQLEELLKSSTKNVAQEVVSCMIHQIGSGLLIELEQLNANIKSKTQNNISSISNTTPSTSFTNKQIQDKNTENQSQISESQYNKGRISPKRALIPRMNESSQSKSPHHNKYEGGGFNTSNQSADSYNQFSIQNKVNINEKQSNQSLNQKSSSIGGVMQNNSMSKQYQKAKQPLYSPSAAQALNQNFGQALQEMVGKRESQNQYKRNTNATTAETESVQSNKQYYQ